MARDDRRRTPATYFVPRDGAFVRVTARDADELRLIRTELELLRRIALAAEWAPRPSHPTATADSSQDQRDELRRILCDANHPAIRQMIAVVDREFGAIQGEIMMSVVNEESQSIAHDAIEAGASVAPADHAAPDPATANESGSPGDPVVAQPGPDDVGNDRPEQQDADFAPADVDQALAAAEAALAEVVGVAMDELGSTPDASETANGFGDERDADTSPSHAVFPVPMDGAESIASVDAPADEPSGSTAPDDSGEVISEAAPGVADVEDGATTMGCSGEYDAEACEAPHHVATDARTPVEYTAADAQRAVAEIENGIRKLADVLRGEVHDRWEQASETLGELAAAREQITATRDGADAAAAEIARLKHEAQIARDEADAARNEALTLREDARRAKQRAETSADIAEKAADQAVAEAKNALAAVGTPS